MRAPRRITLYVAVMLMLSMGQGIALSPWLTTRRLYLKKCGHKFYPTA